MLLVAAHSTPAPMVQPVRVRSSTAITPDEPARPAEAPSWCRRALRSTRHRQSRTGSGRPRRPRRPRPKPAEVAAQFERMSPNAKKGGKTGPTSVLETAHHSMSVALDAEHPVAALVVAADLAAADPGDVLELAKISATKSGALGKGRVICGIAGPHAPGAGADTDVAARPAIDRHRHRAGLDGQGVGGRKRRQSLVNETAASVSAHPSLPNIRKSPVENASILWPEL